MTRANNNLNGTGNSNNVTAHVLNIAFVRPTFTNAAYQLHGFYNFYQKYEHVPEGHNVTSDLDLLTVKIPYGPFLLHDQKPGDPPGIPHDGYFNTIMKHVKNGSTVPIAISNITDLEVNDGKIFSSPDNDTNAFDVLFLFHQEYATQSEYVNLKKFVENGGTIVFNDANILTTQVSYNRSSDSVTLVEGHTWKYDGKSAAWHVERERWANETQQWVGSNFLQDPTKDKITFTNDYFGYKHAEEQYVTNPNDKIMLNFGKILPELGSQVQADESINSTVAIYSLDYGKGKVIMIGIFAHKLENNKDFLDFYDKEILPLATGVTK